MTENNNISNKMFFLFNIKSIYLVKQISDNLIITKFLNIIKDQTNRKARLEHCFAFCEPGKESIVFTGENHGTISKTPRGHDGRWHDFFYIPDGEKRTLAEIGDENPAEKASKYGNAIDQFAKWAKENLS